MACLIVMALINYIYHKLISCMPFYYLYRRDPQAFILVVSTLRATVEPPPNSKVFKAEDKDLDSNKKVLSPPLEENSNGQEAAKQECNKKDNHFITLNTLTTSNKNCDKNYNNLSNIKDNNNQLLILGKSFNRKNKDFNNSNFLDLGITFIGNYNWFKENYNLNNRL